MANQCLIIQLIIQRGLRSLCTFLSTTLYNFRERLLVTKVNA